MHQDINYPGADRASFKRRILAALVISGAATVLVSLLLVDPSHNHVFPPCLFHALTGFYCPGCGSARGLHQLMCGHFLAALRFNPLMIAALPVLAYGGVSELSIMVRGQRLPPLATTARIDWAILSVIIVYWVLRNIQIYPFTLLSPHN